MTDQALTVINKESTDIIPAVQNNTSALAEYEGASLQAVTEDQKKILLEPIDLNDIEIKPEGSPYLPHVKYRRRLNNAFGPMGWSMIPKEPIRMKDSTMYRSFTLYANGRFVAETIGSQKYHENNNNMDYADAAEGVKSNAIERCCKDLGIASELWDPNFIHTWKNSHAIQVWAPNSNGQMKRVWRRIDRNPFEGERPIADVPPPSNQTVTNNQGSVQTQTSLDPTVITDKQRTRLYAIGKNAKWTDEQMKNMLKECGYNSSTEIKKKHYETITEFVENTDPSRLPEGMDKLSLWCKNN